jgi:hypothetical protein
MAPPLADAELVDGRPVADTVAPPLAVPKRDAIEDAGRVARGIVIAILLASPFWVLIALLLIYLL